MTLAWGGAFFANMESGLVVVDKMPCLSRFLVLKFCHLFFDALFIAC